MSNEHSYDRLCDYYRAKQKEKDMTHSKQKHEIGTRKEVIRFAIFPMIIESRFVWLRKYKAVRAYKQFAYWEEWDNEYVFYCKWETIERKIFRR